MQMSAPIIEFKGDFKLKVFYWFSELENRPFYSHALYENKKCVMVLPTCNKALKIDQVIGMYKARLIK